METFTFTGVIVKEERGYASLCLDLDVASQGDTPEEARALLLEAVTLYIESAIESNAPYLRPVPQEEDPRRTTGQQVMEVFPLKVDVAVRAHA